MLVYQRVTCNNIFFSGWKWFHPSQIGSEIQFGVKTVVYHCTLQTAKTRSQIQTQSAYLLVLLPWQPNYPDFQKNLPKSSKISIFQHQPSANGSPPSTTENARRSHAASAEMASLKDFSSRSLVLVITRSSTVRTSVSSESSDGGGHQENNWGLQWTPARKMGLSENVGLIFPMK